MKIELNENKIYFNNGTLKKEIHPFWLRERVDGEEFMLLENVGHDIPEDDYEKQVHRFESVGGIEARYIKVKANPQGTIPEWHLGAGHDRWTFVDELEITLSE